MKNILVIGDSCRDVFIYCDAERLAPDFPVPILNVVHETENVGMAKNVQRNIKRHVDCDIVTNDNWMDITKTRYVHQKTNHTFFRVDSKSPINRIHVNNLNLSNYRLIVISDYNKGFLHEEDIAVICHDHPLVFLDTKKQLGDWADEAAIVKINDYEYKRSILTMSPELHQKVIHTMGSDGCEYRGKRYSVKPVEVKDSSGAGDSFMAALVINYLETKSIPKAIVHANKCASEVVKHRGVTTI